MHTTHSNGRRRTLLAGIALTLTLCTAANAAAYPTTPEGEPLYAETTQVYSSMAPEGLVPGTQSPAVPSTGSDPLPAVTVTSDGTDWITVIAVVAGAGLVALAALAALVLTGNRRRSAAAH